jgi:LuxR family maltose regulon positive regulatory protein
VRALEPLRKYAKLAPPRVQEVLSRPRLFATLDALCGKHAVTWIASPPGAGKTTLVASYLAKIKAPSLWYQFDRDDTDPATLFFFLTQALQDADPALPHWDRHLTSESPGFMRLFFRDFYARLPLGTVLVFDNIDQFDWDNSGTLLEIALGEVPEGVNVLVLSRDIPPARLARLELNGLMATLDWKDLRFDPDEALALALFGESDAQPDSAWVEQLDGWAAGVVMLRDHLARHPNQAAMPLRERCDTIFRYFTAEILERMPVAVQRQLLMLSCLPEISAVDAGRLTGDPIAPRLLKQLSSNHLFIERCAGDG